VVLALALESWLALGSVPPAAGVLGLVVLELESVLALESAEAGRYSSIDLNKGD